MLIPHSNGFTMTRREIRAMLADLKKLRKEGPSRPSCGICANLERLRFNSGYAYPSPYNCLPNLWLDWPHISGDPNYPVPHTDTSTKMYGLLQPSYNAWGRNTTVGELRWNLLDFLIAKLQPLTR